ncbi:hypothetical protein [Kangiella marina]|uniref:Fibronectin type-III domain-containing protein n=1 Tax=Kangiella marina TaxID=1079178 RepID=A0ABP8IH64_9GAMM
MKTMISILTISTLSLASLFAAPVAKASAPTITNFSSEYSGCEGYTPRFLLWWSASTSVLEYDLDYEFWYNGTWYPSYNGTKTGKMFNGSHNTPTKVRVRARNSSGWGPFETIQLPTINCQGGGPIIQ